MKLLVVIVALSLVTFLFGCRAFQPEVIIVNHPPETYIIAAPTEDNGGKFNFHLYWYGTDDDGQVVNYVWALTDSTIQDEETDEDEEDANFNPALSITTLDIGHWTTRTDTIIDFQINDGFNMSRDMTFHIVAQDDRGDFDRTPARLHFLSNALGGPYIEFFKSTVQNDETRITEMDTIGYGSSFEFTWRGGTPNIVSYPPELLAVRDTVPPNNDGLFGFKYRLPDDVNCDDAINDCWNPTRFDFTQGGEVSYFTDISHLQFDNNVADAIDVHQRRLSNGVHQLLVTTVDIAGVELRPADQALNFVINHDPETWILRGEGSGPHTNLYEDDPFNPGNDRIYPFYYIYDLDGNKTSYTNFMEGDVLPNRSIVVFKAIGRDDDADLRFADIDPALAPDFKLQFQGKFDGWGHFRGSDTSLYPISTEYSLLKNSIWDDPSEPDFYSADTLSFNVGPFDYAFSMRSADEHLRRDGTPDVFEFTGNFPPEAHAVEVGRPIADARFNPDGAEYHDTFADTGIDTLLLTTVGVGNVDPLLADHPEWIDITALSYYGDYAWIKPSSRTVLYVEPVNTLEYIKVKGTYYEYELRLFGQDHPTERLFVPASDATEVPEGDSNDRMMSWFYGITSETDVDGRVRDGFGQDNEYFGDPSSDISATSVSYDFKDPDNESRPYVDGNGVWHLRVKVFVPQYLQSNGMSILRSFMESSLGGNLGLVDEAIRLSTVQLGPTNVSVKGRDATLNSVNHCRYVYYTNTRVLEGHNERCEGDPPGAETDVILFENYFKVSETITKRYVIVVQVPGSYYPYYP